jgi:hypothetical protein
MELTLTGRCLSLKSIRIATKLVQDGGVSASFRVHYFSAPSEHFLPKNYLKFSLQFPAAHMELSWNDRRSLNSAPIAMELGAVGTS